MTPTVYRPKPREGLHTCNREGSFRGLITQWGELGLAKVIEHANPFCWWGAIGDVLLYDRPTYEWLNPSVEYRLGLFANPDPPFNGRLNSHWIFWPCWPRLTEKYARLKCPTWEQRSVNLAFIGSHENIRQRGNRSGQRWQSACDHFEYFTGYHKYRTSEYLRVLRKARFGLCLPGYGPKCLREIEYMALGIVPIVTYGCNVSYFDAWQRDAHYLLADSPEHAKHLATNTSPEQWAYMSNAGREWYFRNSSARGSFETTERLIAKMQSA